MGESGSKSQTKQKSVPKKLQPQQKQVNSNHGILNSAFFSAWTISQKTQFEGFLRTKAISLTDEILGQGGFGIVIKAFSFARAKHVAVKILKFSSRQQFFNNMEEFNHQQQLIHPNVLLGLEILNNNELQIQVIVMELCQTDLMTYLEKCAEETKWPTKKNLLETWLQLIDGLIFLHDKGVLHLDIKPSNILFGTDNKWKYTDFGLSHTLSDGELSTLNPKGYTPLSSSPEQYLHHSLQIKQNISKESDIYSLGLVFLVTTQVILELKQSINMKLDGKALDPLLNPKYTELNQDLLQPMLRTDPTKRLSLSEARTIVLKHLKDELQFSNQTISSTSKLYLRNKSINGIFNSSQNTSNTCNRNPILPHSMTQVSLQQLPEETYDDDLQEFAIEKRVLTENSSCRFYAKDGKENKKQETINGQSSSSLLLNQAALQSYISIGNLMKLPKIHGYRESETVAHTRYNSKVSSPGIQTNNTILNQRTSHPISSDPELLQETKQKQTSYRNQQHSLSQFAIPNEKSKETITELISPLRRRCRPQMLESFSQQQQQQQNGQMQIRLARVNCSSNTLNSYDNTTQDYQSTKPQQQQQSSFLPMSLIDLEEQSERNQQCESQSSLRTIAVKRNVQQKERFLEDVEILSFSSKRSIQSPLKPLIQDDITSASSQKQQGSLRYSRNLLPIAVNTTSNNNNNNTSIFKEPSRVDPYASPYELFFPSTTKNSNNNSSSSVNNLSIPGSSIKTKTKITSRRNILLSQPEMFTQDTKTNSNTMTIATFDNRANR